MIPIILGVFLGFALAEIKARHFKASVDRSLVHMREAYRLLEKK